MPAANINDYFQQYLRGQISSVSGGTDAATDIQNSSGNVAAGAAVATLAGVAGKVTYITGFAITGGGATGASVISITVAGIASTMTFELGIPAGVTAGVTPLIVTFNRPIPATGLNTAIIVTAPSFGAGNTNACATAWGFQL